MDTNTIEYINDLIEKDISNIHTFFIAKVIAVNENTIDCVPVIGEKKVLLKRVPLLTLQGGSNYIRIMPAINDYCLVLIAENNHDSWYVGSDNVPAMNKRKHNISDCFAIVGVNNLKNPLPQMDANIVIKGDTIKVKQSTITLDSSSDIIIGGISLSNFIKDHKHGGVQIGSGTTGIPI